MSDNSQNSQNHEGQEPAPNAGTRLIPRITVQAFCENSQTAQLIESALSDRRMSKVALTTHNGSIEGAIETYRSNPTPNLILVETSLPTEQIPVALEEMAQFCDPGTHVIVLGQINDVHLYRSLIKSGVAEYIVLPTSTDILVSAIAEIFVADDSPPIGRTIGFISAKGGSGSSTVSHNSAWMAAQALRQDVLIVDMDLPFGTAGLNFNQDPPNGIADAVYAQENLDVVMLDRLISKAANNINLLTAPVSLEKSFDFGASDFEQVIELVQSNIPLVILDIPHLWTSWVRHTLIALDEIVIVAEPDLANLRNTKTLVDTIANLRPGESKPMLVLNKVGLPKRPEIPSAEFASAVDCELIEQIAFDAPTFGTAANNGQMIAEVSSGSRLNDSFKNISARITGRQIHETTSKLGGLDISGLLKKLKRA
ncbi:Type II/IV secretion system ATPase TadZ/CpaE, associated with Flp pilus assembly [hydrothermal vent metagenome]|uniref:Type II/IV secretion system ATPase TadZ/CpaE, associated with Flp pilus assembly n=1 Tax=hydrothermal vent metagenome TaxID=652676 RepID=A0A3B0U446_9ZZZZ